MPPCVFTIIVLRCLTDQHELIRKMKSDTLTFRLLPEEKDAFMAACAAADITAGQVVRQLVRGWMKAQQAKAEAKAAKERQKEKR
jgi:hypothetical protein